MTLIIGNTITFIASIFMVCTGIIKEKLKLIYAQTVMIILFIISNIILGGITGAITNFINLIRNILYYKNKFALKEKIIISLILIILSITTNNLGIIGLLPLISGLLYIWFIDIKDMIKFKILIIVTTLLWLIYDLTIKSYTSSIFYVATIIASIVSIIQILIKRKTSRD